MLRFDLWYHSSKPNGLIARNISRYPRKLSCYKSNDLCTLVSLFVGKEYKTKRSNLTIYNGGAVQLRLWSSPRTVRTSSLAVLGPRRSPEGPWPALGTNISRIPPDPGVTNFRGNFAFGVPSPDFGTNISREPSEKGFPETFGIRDN